MQSSDKQVPPPVSRVKSFIFGTPNFKRLFFKVITFNIGLYFIYLMKYLLFIFQVELVDMHFGTDKDPLANPFQFGDHIHEIKECHKISRGCFYLVSGKLIFNKL